MKVLVTGAAGFIGSHITKELLNQGHAVRALDMNYSSGRLDDVHGNIELLKADITKTDLQGFNPGPIDCVIHMAAIAAPILCDQQPDLAFNVNVQGTHNVLKLAHKLKVKKLVFASSSHVYGIPAKYLPTDERAPMALFDTYTVCKAIGEYLCQGFYENYGLNYTVIRLFNCYGPGQLPGYFVPDMVVKAKTGEIKLKGGQIVKDFVYIQDVARAFIKAAESSFIGPINIGSGIGTQLQTVAGYIAYKTGAKLTPVPGGTDSAMRCDWSRAEKVLGWRPEISLEEGLDRTIESWRNK